MKQCKKCNRTKDLNEFYRMKKAKDGRQSYCRDCHLKGANEWNNEYRDTHTPIQSRNGSEHQAYTPKVTLWQRILKFFGL